jgi:circadian clock protein KaiB
MPRRKIINSAKEFEEALKKPPRERYLLRLYVAGMTPRSSRAVARTKEICEKYLKGRYELEVVDIYQHGTLSKGEQIVAAPTLIKKLPLPLRRVIGDMTNTEKILLGLDLRPIPGEDSPKPSKKSKKNEEGKAKKQKDR